jgi:hypothetical protein
MSFLKKAVKESKIIGNNILNKPNFNSFAKEKTSQKDQEMMKYMIYDYVDINFSKHFQTDIQYNEMELFIWNHKGWLCGYFDDDYTSADHLLMRCSLKDPKGLILGDCHISDIENFKNVKYSNPPKIENINGQNLLGRQGFLDYFKNNFPSNIRYIKEFGDYVISELDFIHHRKIFNANLTLAYYSCYYNQKKIIYGGAQNLLHLEDLVIQLPLEELQYLFIVSIQEFKLRAKKHEFLPSTNPPELYFNLKNLVQEVHTEKLFDKKCQYSAAVFKKIHKIYPDNILFMPNHLIMKTYEHM